LSTLDLPAARRAALALVCTSMNEIGAPRRARCDASRARKKHPAPSGSRPERSNVVRALRIDAAPRGAIVVRN